MALKPDRDPIYTICDGLLAPSPEVEHTISDGLLTPIEPLDKERKKTLQRAKKVVEK